MKKILVIAQNEAKADLGAQLLSAFTVKKVYPGAKRVPRHFDAVVIYHNDAGEVNFIKDEIQRYHDAPIKAFIGKTAYSGAAAHKAQAFTHEQANQMVEHLKTQYSQLVEVMNKIFKSFDKDNSGFIDINELK